MASSRGTGVAANPEEAKRLLALSAAKRDKYAQFSLYALALKREHYKRAYYWLRICEEERHPPTRNELATCPPDHGELERWLSPSARATVEHDGIAAPILPAQ